MKDAEAHLHHNADLFDAGTHAYMTVKFLF